jgi:hypothetical protein
MNTIEMDFSLDEFPPQISAESYRLNCSDAEGIFEETSCKVVIGNSDDNNYFKVGKHKIPKLPECKTLGDAFPLQISAESYRL